jgi:uncharacterized protein
MLIVSDTGPLRYLIEVAAIDALPRLYGEIATTPAVVAELSLHTFPAIVQQWAAHPPTWLVIESPTQNHPITGLDPGEASALCLAIERRADAVLIDERDGTHVARSNGLRTLGTLTVLQAAGLAGLIDFRSTLDRLITQTRFHHSRQLIAMVIAEYARLEAQK